MLPWLKQCPCSTIEILHLPKKQPLATAFGYDYTQYATDFFLSECEHGSNNIGADRSCTRDYVLFTNGDNLFNVATFHTLLPYIRNGTNVIGFSFVSHYSRGGYTNGCVNSKLKLFNADLSSVIYSYDTVRQAAVRGVNFVPWKNEDWAPADGIWLEAVIAASNASTVTLKNVLSFHQ